MKSIWEAEFRVTWSIVKPKKVRPFRTEGVGKLNTKGFDFAEIIAGGPKN
jgi:hypothetical protein